MMRTNMAKNENSSSNLGRLFRRFINVRKWLDWERVVSSTQFFINFIKTIFVPQNNAPTETFTEAQSRLQLTEEMLQAKQRGLLRTCYTMLIAALLFLFYGIYQLWTSSFIGTILSIVIMSVALVLAFRYHFLQFQIQQRKLGCSFKEWFHQGLCGEKR